VATDNELEDVALTGDLAAGGGMERGGGGVEVNAAMEEVGRAGSVDAREGRRHLP
jgi:hypothetical protein